MTPQRIGFAQLKHHWRIYLLALPAMVMVGLFVYYPAFSGVVHSFYRWNGADIKEYVGLENYRRLLGDEQFWRSFRVAMILGLWNIVKMIPAVAVAVCIHRCRSTRMQFLYRLAFVVPMVIPVLVVVLIWRGLFFETTSGYLNAFLLRTHLFDVLVWADAVFHWGGIFTPGKLPAWLGDEKLILTACVIWGFPWVGSFAVLTHLAKLQNIPRELYEAAELDGVGWWRKFTRLELPLMMGSVNIMLVFVVIDTIKDAGTILALAGLFGGPGGVVTVPALFMLRKAFIDQQMGAACAVGIVLTVVVMVLQKVMTAMVAWGERGFGRRRSRLGAGSQTSEGRRVHRFHRFTQILVLRRVGGWGLRVAKHGFVWGVLALAYLPLYLMLIVSVKNNSQFYASPAHLTFPLHWENWGVGWQAVIPALANSIFVTACSTALTLVLALGGAYFFARVRAPGSALLWNGLLILMMMPTIANLIPLMRLLIDLNLANTLTAIIGVGAAGGQVFAIFMLRNFVADIPQSLFEAADLDGAGHFRQLVTIVVPLSAPILGVVGVMHAIGQWNDFVLPLIVLQDQARLTVMVQLLRLAGEYIKYWGPLMAGYAIASVPIIVLFAMCMRLFSRGLTEGAEKG